MKDTLLKHQLRPGSLVKGGRATYRILGTLTSDGNGYTYHAEIPRIQPGPTRQVVVREHFMPRCSLRAADGITVETPEEIAPTVKTCLDAFAQASKDRLALSRQCPSLVEVLDVFPANNTYYYVVEYLGGTTLEEYVASKGHLSFEETRDILSPILDAVRTLHMSHTIHTDITPAHIRFYKDPSGQEIPVLFSLYCSLHFNEDGTQRWDVPMLNCRDGYAPPEQYVHIDHFYPQVDIYALAATMVYALTGKHLPDSRNVTPETVRAILPATFPETFTQALVKALSPSVQHRTSSISAFRADLVAFYGGKRRPQPGQSSASPAANLLTRLRSLLKRQ